MESKPEKRIKQCNRDGCSNEVNEGLGYQCGGGMLIDGGCGRHFCGDHLSITDIGPLCDNCHRALIDKIIYDDETSQLFYRNPWEALKLARSINYSSNEILDYHLYWRDQNPFGVRHLTALDAIIKTQKNCGSITVWKKGNVSIPSRLRRYVSVRDYNIKQLSKGTPIEDYEKADSIDNFAWLGGDLARMLVLYKYGGIYLDFDMIAIRDMSPLSKYEFVHQWGNVTKDDNSKHAFNGAVMRFYQNSPILERMLLDVTHTEPIENSGVWGSELYTKIFYKYPGSFKVLPSAFFDPAWHMRLLTGIDNWGMQNIGGDRSRLFDGAFCQHLHNRWHINIEDGSRIGKLIKSMSRKGMEG